MRYQYSEMKKHKKLLCLNVLYELPDDDSWGIETSSNVDCFY